MTLRALLLSALLLLVIDTSHAYQTKKIIIGIYENHPLVGQTIDGEPEGFFVEIIKEIARKEGWSINFTIDSFGNDLKQLKDNKIDLIAAIARTEEREQSLDFARETVCTLWGVIYVQPDSKVQTVLDLDGKTIAVMEKGVFGKAFKKLSGDFSIKPHFVFTESQAESINLLKKRKVDAAIFNNAFKEAYGATDIKRTAITYNPMQITFATNKGYNSDLLKTIDQHLRKWKAADNSFYYQLLDKWIGTVEIQKEHIPNWFIYTFASTVIIVIMASVWVLTLLRYIRQRRIAENVLIDSENRFKSLSNAAFEGIIVSDNGKIIDFNATITSMFGYSAKELEEMNNIDLIPSEEKDKVQSRILSGYEGPYEVNGITKDGKIFPMEAHAKMFIYQGRQVRVTALRDLSEQKEAAEEIKTLRGILPICSFCKKIRNDDGYYEQIEAYIHKHTGVDFSHTICHPCMKEHYPEEYEKLALR